MENQRGDEQENESGCDDEQLIDLIEKGAVERLVPRSSDAD